MFSVTEAQIEAMRVDRVDKCERRLFEAIKNDFESDTDRLGPDATRAVVRWGMKNSRSHNRNTERDMYIYLALMFMLGSYFDKDPQLPWVRKILDGGGSMDKIHERVMRYMDHVIGENNENLVQALMECRHLDLESLPTPFQPNFNSRCLQLLQSIFPQKFQHQGKQATLMFINQSVALSKAYKMEKGSALLAILGFILGSGVDKDPVHPWIQDILQDTALDSEAKRQSVHREGLKFIEKSLRQSA